MDLVIRLAVESDTDDILAIYSPIILNSHTSFEYEVPTSKQMWQRISSVLQERPWLVAERNGTIVGYCYATQVRGREAYSWSAELSVYVSEGEQGKGIGKRLYLGIIKLLELQRTRNFYGVISLPNKGSEIFHERLGFKKISEFNNIGFKNGQWYSIAWYFMRKGGDIEAAPFQPLSKVSSSEEWKSCMQAINS